MSAAHLEEAMASLLKGSTVVARQVLAADENVIPAFDYTSGHYETFGPYNPDEWAHFQWGGFLAGRLWLLATYYRNSELADAAARLARTMARTLTARPPRFSAAGIDIFYGVCLGARVTGDRQLVDAGLAAVRQYAKNFDERCGVFFQIPGVNRAVIDTGLNLLPFYWAGEWDPSLPSYALDHNRKLLRDGIVREDGSTFQAIEYDLTNGRPARRFTLQGHRDESTWARGQSWAIHNYVNAYEASRDPEFLATARRVGRWYVENLPESKVPYYDFSDPDIPEVPRDTCSAAIAANALMKLGQLDPESAGWALPAADGILDRLIRDHLTPDGVVLHSSWGRLRREKAAGRITRFPREEILPYGNYWIAELLFRKLADDVSILRLSVESAKSEVSE